MRAKVTLRCSYTYSGNIRYQQHQETHHQAKWDLEQQQSVRSCTWGPSKGTFVPGAVCGGALFRVAEGMLETAEHTGGESLGFSDTNHFFHSRCFGRIFPGLLFGS